MTPRRTAPVDLNVKVGAELLERLRDYSRSSGRTMAAVVNEALTGHLDPRQDGKGAHLPEDEDVDRIHKEFFHTVSAEIDRVRAEFFRSLSHELRTPLTAIIGYSELALAEDPGEVSDHVHELIEPIHQAGQRLEKLIVDLLEVQDLMSGTGAELRRLMSVRRMVEDVLIGLDTQGHELTVDVPDTEISVDPVQIERMLDKLIENAIKHTEPGSRISVHGRRTSASFILTVEDDGPGVADELKDEIFDPLRRANPESTQSGTGVGLTLVGLYAELHGGEAWVEDVLGGGARFVVRLPLAS